MKNYGYKFIDNGLLTPFFNQWLIEPLIKRIPSYISPNLITFLSLLFSTGGLFSALYFGHTPLGVTLASLFHFLYVVSDAVDGTYARDNEISTALGEFLDHFHDLYAVGTIHFTFFYFFEVTTPFILIFSLTLNYIYAGKRFHQLYHTGQMIFPKISTWEQTLIIKAFYFISLHPDAHKILVESMETLLLISVSINIWAFRKELLQTIKEKWQFGLYFLLSFSLHYLLPGYDTHHILFFIILYNLFFIGNVIKARLTSTPYPVPDLIAPLILLIGPETFLTYGLALSYLGARVICLFLTTTAELLTHVAHD